jgi:hypothetical protein
MTDRPILFSAPMVRALLDGRKTQTRRALGQFDVFTDSEGRKAEVSCLQIEGEPLPRVTIGRVVTLKKLKAAVGDRLWVREHWRTTQAFEDLPPSAMTPENARIKYLADDFIDNKGKAFAHFYDGRHRAGMHMPRWASRLTLTVTDIRVERLQDISRGDAMEEGCPFPNMASGPNPCRWYAELWDEINGSGAWAANPWVAAYTFTVERTNIGEVQP